MRACGSCKSVWSIQRGDGAMGYRSSTSLTSSSRLLTGQERDPEEFIQRHYRPHTERENVAEIVPSETHSSMHRKAVSGEDEGKSSLASQTPHFPQEKMHRGVHLNFPTGKAFSSTSQSWKISLSCQEKKKHILQSYDGNLRIALGAQVGAGMSRPHNPNDFLFQQQVTGDDQRGGLLNRPMEAGTWVLWHGAPGPSVLQTPP